MDQQTIIAQLEARAKAAGLSIKEACRAANVHPTTFSRWKLSDRNTDPVGASLKSLAALDAAIAAAEKVAA